VDSAQALLDRWIASDAKEGLSNSLKVRKIQIWGQSGRAQDALRYGLEWIAESPDDPVPKLALLEVLGSRGQLEDDQVRAWLAQAKGQPQLMLRTQRIISLGKAKRFDEAVAAARQWIAQSPGLLAPRQVIMDVLIEGGQTPRAVELVDQWIARSARNWRQPARPRCRRRPR